MNTVPPPFCGAMLSSVPSTRGLEPPLNSQRTGFPCSSSTEKVTRRSFQSLASEIAQVA